jgi:hypothetical protein
MNEDKLDRKKSIEFSKKCMGTLKECFGSQNVQHSENIHEALAEFNELFYKLYKEAENEKNKKKEDK